MPRRHVRPPVQVVLIAIFQFMKGGFLLGVAAYLWFAPDALPHTEAFTQMLFIAAHGRDLSGVLVPVFGVYVIYIGIGLMRLWKSVRRNLALSSAITICVSLQRLGVFGESNMTSNMDRQTLYIIIFIDFVIYIYLAFHPEITRSFREAK